jgi:small multidrug resistance pump
MAAYTHYPQEGLRLALACRPRDCYAASGSAIAGTGMSSQVALIIAILSEVAATSALKASDGFRNLIPSVVVVIGYGAAFYFLSLALRTIPMGVAYAIWSGVGIVLISLAGWFLYAQKLDLAALAGIVLIIAGVFVLQVLSGAADH